MSTSEQILRELLSKSPESWKSQPDYEGTTPEELCLRAHEEYRGRRALPETKSVDLKTIQALLASRRPHQTSEKKLSELNKKISDLAEVVSVQKKTLEVQGKALAEIQEILAIPEAPELDDFDKWVSSKEAEKFAGHYVAFVPGEGPILAEKNLGELMQKLRGHPQKNKAAIGIVPCLMEAF